MKNFILAFPFVQTEIDLLEGPFLMPGCTISFTGKKQNQVFGLEEVFLNHAPLEESEREKIKNHKVLYFLQGEFKTVEEFESLNRVISQILEMGALGIYMENSGAAWSAASFLEWIEHEDPMHAWLNFIETAEDLYTLGMETFGRPDLCVRLHHGEKEELQTALADVAESLFLEESVFDTGVVIQLESSPLGYEIYKETKQPYSKDSMEHNRKGVWRLVPKK